jgi:hypothetical protein
MSSSHYDLERSVQVGGFAKAVAGMIAAQYE